MLLRAWSHSWGSGRKTWSQSLPHTSAPHRYPWRDSKPQHTEEEINVGAAGIYTQMGFPVDMEHEKIQALWTFFFKWWNL